MKIAIIREQDCIGCAKCLPACPVDAIVGAPKFMHSVLAQECIGCELCIAPCPVDCIEMITLSKEETAEERKARALKAKTRYQARQQRKLSEQSLQLRFDTRDPNAKENMKLYIQTAFTRSQKKRNANMNEKGCRESE